MSTDLSIVQLPFGKIDTVQIDQFVLKNANGMEVRIINYGGIITHLFVPGRAGKVEDVVLGFDALEDYIKPHPYFGCIVGRYANRIANGQFSIDGKTYRLASNAKAHHLHGGIVGFDKKIWLATPIETTDQVGVQLEYLSPDGEEGYPGNLKTSVTYTLNIANELGIHYKATTDQATVLNFTNHSYFNLKGAGNGTILDHELQIDADAITEADDQLIPTGEHYAVANTPFDFRTAKPIGKDIDQLDDPQLAKGNGYDHNFIFNASEDALALRARVYEPSSGRQMELLTTQPATQLYTCKYEGAKIIEGKLDKQYAGRAAFCLETQHFPDAPNHDHFPTTVLHPDEVFESTTIYRFSNGRKISSSF